MSPHSKGFIHHCDDCPLVESYLPGLLDAFRPDLVLYDAGVDPHWEDELGRLRLTDQGQEPMSDAITLKYQLILISVH